MRGNASFIVQLHTSRYTEQHYLPAATAYRNRTALGGTVGTNIVRWERSLREKWSSIRFGEMRVDSVNADHVFEVDVYLDGLDPGVVRVELYANAVDDDPVVRQAMTQLEPTSESEPNWFTYRATVSVPRPASDFTPRIIPQHEGVNVPLELDLIRWQR